MEQCPICDGEGRYLGTMGYMDHYVCRDCGMQFSIEMTDEEKDAYDAEMMEDYD